MEWANPFLGRMRSRRRLEPFQSFRVRFRQSDGIQLRFQLVEFRFGLFRQDIVICREGMADRRPEFFEQFPALPVFEK